MDSMQSKLHQSWFTPEQLDNLFAALILHTKTTRSEESEWLFERAILWDRIVSLSENPPSELTQFRSELFHSPKLLKNFWKDPALLVKAFHA
jgi:hypothetical protein